MNTHVNKTELASELADRRLNQIHQEGLINNDCMLFPNGILRELENGDTVYTDAAQNLFNKLYDDYWAVIETSEIARTKTYFALGDELTQLIDEKCTDDVILKFCSQTGDFEIFCFEEGTTTPQEFAHVVLGWNAYTLISKELYYAIAGQ